MRRLVAVAAALCGLLAPAAASAAEITVDVAGDEYLDPGPGNGCSLREAIQAANSNDPFGGCESGEASLDTLAMTQGGYGISRTGRDEDGNETGDFDIDTGGGDVVIQGQPTVSIVDSANKDRAFDVTGSGALTLESLRLIAGDPVGAEPLADQSGAGVRWLGPGSSGDLTIRGSVIFGNDALYAGAVDAQTTGEHLIEDSTLTDNTAADLGAVRSQGSLTVRRSTVSRNLGGGIEAQGTGPDALEVDSSSVVGNPGTGESIGAIRVTGGASVVNSTISGNFGGFVGGIDAAGQLDVRFSTIADNLTSQTGATGGVYVDFATGVHFEGVILAGNRRESALDDCGHPVEDISEGPAPSLDSAGDCGLDGPGAIVDSDAGLAPLGANGGPTKTRGLYPDSPAIDSAGGCLPGFPLDQRGFARPLGGACDIGAFEGSVPRPPPDEPDPPQTTPPKKKKKKCKKARGKRGKGAKRKKCRKKKRKRRAAGAGVVAEGASTRTVIGRSARGREVRAVRVGDPSSERVALVVGAIHGDERAGMGIARKLRRLGPEVEDAQIWVVDNLNPDGTRARMRRNANGVDLNRNFPHRWRGGVPGSSGYYPGPRAASERETRAAMALIRRIQPDVSIWYHQPWGAVLACRGRPSLGVRYARLSGMETSCRGRGLRGTAIGWTKAQVDGATAFVVELGSGRLSGRAERRHARAAARIAEES